MTAWRPFILQNSNGRGGLNFWAAPFKFWKLTNFLKLSKWFYYTKSKSLLVSEIKKKWIWVLSPSIETSMGTACLYWWFFRILKEIKVSPITFKVMPNMGNTVSVVCRLEFVYGHHQLELNRPKGTILKNVLRFCWHLWIPLWTQPIQFAFFWFNLNRDRNYLLHMYLYTLCNRLFRTLTLKPGPSSH